MGRGHLAGSLRASWSKEDADGAEGAGAAGDCWGGGGANATSDEAGCCCCCCCWGLSPVFAFATESMIRPVVVFDDAAAAVSGFDEGRPAIAAAAASSPSTRATAGAASSRFLKTSLAAANSSRICWRRRPRLRGGREREKRIEEVEAEFEGEKQKKHQTKERQD